MVLRESAGLRRTLDANLWAGDDPTRVVIAFLAGEPRPGAEERLAALRAGREEFASSVRST